MEFPYETIKVIRPEWNDSRENSTEYTFSEKDIVTGGLGEDGVVFRFPFSRDTFWTHFSYSCMDINGFLSDDLDISIILTTKSGYKYILYPSGIRKQGKWHELQWSIPSMDFSKESGFFIKIGQISDSRKYFLNVRILGFQGLYPERQNYILFTENTPQFLFSRSSADSGHILRVENDYYIRDIINSSVYIEELV